jgi:hypothetical protein
MTTDPDVRTPAGGDALMDKEVATVRGWEQWCRELLGRVRRSLGNVDLAGAKRASRHASHTSRDLVWRVQDAERFSARCGKPVSSGHSLDAATALPCERLRGHSGDCDVPTGSSPAQRLVRRCRDLTRTLEDASARMADIALDVDRTVAGVSGVDVRQSDLDDVANRLDDVGQQLTQLSAELVDVPISPPAPPSPVTVAGVIYVDPDRPDVARGDGVGL